MRWSSRPDGSRNEAGPSQRRIGFGVYESLRRSDRTWQREREPLCLLVEAGLPRIRVHDLRHTTATTLLEAGIHPKVVQDLLGHSTIAITLDTHSHIAPTLHLIVLLLEERPLARQSQAIDTKRPATTREAS
jgi:integrase